MFWGFTRRHPTGATKRLTEPAPALRIERGEVMSIFSHFNVSKRLARRSFPPGNTSSCANRIAAPTPRQPSACCWPSVSRNCSIPRLTHGSREFLQQGDSPLPGVCRLPWHGRVYRLSFPTSAMPLKVWKRRSKSSTCSAR